MMAGIGEFLTRGARKLGEAGLTDADKAAARALHANMDNSTRLERMMHNNGVLTAGDVKSRLFSSAMVGGAVAAPFGLAVASGTGSDTTFADTMQIAGAGAAIGGLISAGINARRGRLGRIVTDAKSFAHGVNTKQDAMKVNFAKALFTDEATLQQEAKAAFKNQKGYDDAIRKFNRNFAGQSDSVQGGFSFNDSIKNAANQMKEAVLGTANANASKLSGFNPGKLRIGPEVTPKIPPAAQRESLSKKAMQSAIDRSEQNRKQAMQIGLNNRVASAYEGTSWAQAESKLAQKGLNARLMDAVNSPNVSARAINDAFDRRQGISASATSRLKAGRSMSTESVFAGSKTYSGLNSGGTNWTGANSSRFSGGYNSKKVSRYG
jgi:hypothetical protein|nr:MAG TPA: hypothetical protein [Caudoviricetes sp.]